MIELAAQAASALSGPILIAITYPLGPSKPKLATAT